MWNALSPTDIGKQYSSGTSGTLSCLVTAFSIGGAAKEWHRDMARAMGADLNTSLRIVVHNGTTLQSLDTMKFLRTRGALWHVREEDDGLKWHSKMTIRGWKSEDCTCNRAHGWFLVGSHNWSKSSWGDKALWELSVLSISTCNAGSLVDMRKVPLPFSPSLVCPFAWNHELSVSTMNSKGIVLTETLKILGPSNLDPDHCVIAAPP